MLHHMVEDFVNCGAISLDEVTSAFEKAAEACDCPGYATFAFFAVELRFSVKLIEKTFPA